MAKKAQKVAFDIAGMARAHFDNNFSALAREFEVTPAAVYLWADSGVTPQRKAQLELWLIQRGETLQ